MKGVVFVALENLVQDKFGLAKWNQIIKNSNIESGGIYTRGEFYNDKELLSILDQMTIILNKKKENLLMIFGMSLIHYFFKQYPHFFKNQTLESFLVSINGVVHSEIRKLNIEATPPEILFDPITKEITYKSNRKLCPLAFGLIKGASNIFNTPIAIKHDENICQNKGADCCKFIIELK